jgi:hypothetical protein
MLVCCVWACWRGVGGNIESISGVCGGVQEQQRRQKQQQQQQQRWLSQQQGEQ